MFFTIKLSLHLNCVLIINWIVRNRTIFIKMDLALNNLQRLICHKLNQPTNYLSIYLSIFHFSSLFFNDSSVSVSVVTVTDSQNKGSFIYVCNISKIFTPKRIQRMIMKNKILSTSARKKHIRRLFVLIPLSLI